METQACPTCWAVVPTEMIERHEQWHDRIATVAIESTQRIDALTEQLRKVLNARL